jgi:hypothetical protein
MDIPAKLVKELRDRTGAGFMDAKRALQEANGDLDAAAEVLRKTGLAKADKRLDREAKEGKIGFWLSDDRSRGIMVELNCETDFVARTDEFKAFLDAIVNAIKQNKPENLDALLKITRSTRMPICVGENLYLRQGFRDLLQKQAADVIMPDLSKCGGLSEGRKIAHMAEIYYVPFAPHNNSGPLSTLADSHVCASVPNFLALEFHRFGDETWDGHLALDSSIVQDGHVVFQDAPGLGAELDEEYVQQFTSSGGALFG